MKLALVSTRSSPCTRLRIEVELGSCWEVRAVHGGRRRAETLPVEESCSLGFGSSLAPAVEVDGDDLNAQDRFKLRRRLAARNKRKRTEVTARARD